MFFDFFDPSGLKKSFFSLPQHSINKVQLFWKGHTKFWKNLPLALTLLSKNDCFVKTGRRFFQILWPSHNFLFGKSFLCNFFVKPWFHDISSYKVSSRKVLVDRVSIGKVSSGKVSSGKISSYKLQNWKGLSCKNLSAKVLFCEVFSVKVSEKNLKNSYATSKICQTQCETALVLT